MLLLNLIDLILKVCIIQGNCIGKMFSRVPLQSMLVWSERKLTAMLCHGRIKAWEKLFLQLSLRLFFFLRNYKIGGVF